MSVHDPIGDADAQHATLPAFELSFAFDDEEDPEWVTVFAGSRDAFETEWMTIDAEHAVELADVA